MVINAEQIKQDGIGDGDHAAVASTDFRRHHMTKGDWSFLFTSQVFLTIWAALVILPLLWMVVSAFKTDAEILSSPWSIPGALQMDNFVRAWNEARIGRYIWNTVVVVGFGVVGTLLVSSMAAYALSRFQWPGNRVIYYLFVAGLMFPTFLALVPLYFVVQDLGLLGTKHGLVLVYIAYSLPFSIFFLHGFFKNLPTDLAEAAIIDGAGPYRVFFQIMLPLARPGIIAMAIFNFLGQWNQYLLPLVLNADQNNYVIAQGLQALNLNQGYRSDWSALFAGLTITMVPMLVVYIVFQRRLEGGLTAGALKG
ncbi:MAG TPA: carbohydrate ABC transporter permease [Thermomicrobiales bacterium]|jgi:N-acetylglucosamine transport system permease protein|nr:carbohydrate ABC transporter permease [Thermomicrobiales bacterium]